MASQDKVLVTGGTGYLAAWTIAQLLEQGHAVRTTVRRQSRAAALKAKLGDPDRLEIVEADLLSDAGWSEAMSGIRYVIHAAAPMLAKPDELLAASRHGSLRVLRAAAANGVERVVVTSSGYAVQPSPGPRGSVATVDETMWANPDAPGAGAYARAKTLAERDAWDFAAAHPGLELTTVLPGYMLGPLQSDEVGPSMALIDGMLKGQVPALPDIGMSMVDIRDVADLHIRALLHPEARGQRFLASARFVWFRDVAALLRRELGADANRVPTRRMPDLAVRALGLVLPPLRDFVPRLGRELHLDHTKATRLLDWRPRPIDETILDAASDLLRRRRP